MGISARSDRILDCWASGMKQGQIIKLEGGSVRSIKSIMEWARRRGDQRAEFRPKQPAKKTIKPACLRCGQEVATNRGYRRGGRGFIHIACPPT
jgi:hypothetical protein